MSEQRNNQWWQPRPLALEACWQCTVGPLTLYFKRGLHEWQFSFERMESRDTPYSTCSQSAVCLPELLTSQRFIFRHSPTTFRLTPTLLERPLVVKTRQPVSIPPGEHCVFYISSPVCIAVSLEHPDTPLLELPVQRLSDTWFGASTQHGELCYADKTQARHNLADIPQRPHRAITAVTIENRSNTMLTIDKISIPLPLLAVYGHHDGNLWTDPITLQHEGESQLTRYKITKDLPAGLSRADLLAEARHQPDKHHFIRAFTGIFSQ